MRVIQTLSDIEALKTSKAIPLELIEVIEQDFLHMYEAETNDVYLLNFHLTPGLILLEQGDDVLQILNNQLGLEYVDKEKTSRPGVDYYRIGFRSGHTFQLIYSLIGIHDKEAEAFLAEQAEWNEREW